MKVPRWLLQQRQAMPLEQKIELSRAKIKEWYEHWDGMVYVAFSGGKDSTVLLHLVREMYPEVPGVFCNTGLEYPEIVQFVATHKNIITLRPDMNFRQVIKRYGYPVVSKRIARFTRDLQNESDSNWNTCNLRRTGYNRKGVYCPSHKLPKKWTFLVDAPFSISEQCCDALKKRPYRQYNKKSGRVAITGMMASDSSARQKAYLETGCNAFSFKTKASISQPIAFWMERDILEYLSAKDVPYASVYGKISNVNGELATDGVSRTGCIFCAFGVHLESEPNRFQHLKQTHPKLWSYCMNQLGMAEVLDYIGVPYV